MLLSRRVAEVDVIEFYSILNLDVGDALAWVLRRLDLWLTIDQIDDLPAYSQRSDHCREQTLDLQDSEHREHEGLIACHNISHRGHTVISWIVNIILDKGQANTP